MNPATGERNHLHVLCVGLSRSGSTWQYNMVRHLVGVVAAGAAEKKRAATGGGGGGDSGGGGGGDDSGGGGGEGVGEGEEAAVGAETFEVSMAASEVFSDLHECLHARFCVAKTHVFNPALLTRADIILTAHRDVRAVLLSSAQMFKASGCLWAPWWGRCTV